MSQKKKLIIFLICSLITRNTLANADYSAAIINAAFHKAGTAPPNKLITLQGSTVRMVIFTDDTTFLPSKGSIPLHEMFWTSVEPELKKLCHAYVIQKKTHGLSLNVWIARLLGLPENDASIRRFVVLDVPVIQANSPNTIGIFRPCTDPRIGPHTDHTPICPAQMDAANSHISSAYKTWFINNSITSYERKNGYPWTEYGYTYNWNHSSNAYGVSEFVVTQNTPVNILSNPHNSSTAYLTAEEYCS